MGKDWDKNQEPPAEFQIQLQHQLAVTGLKRGSIAACVGGCRFVWSDLDRDDEFIEMLIKAEAEFWARLVDRRPPTPDDSLQTAAALEKLFAREKPDAVIVPLDVELVDAHLELRQAKKDLKLAEDRKRGAENRLKAAIGDNLGGRLPNGVFYTWKSQTRKAHEVKESTFRVLRVNEPKVPLIAPPGADPFALEEASDE